MATDPLYSASPSAPDMYGCSTFDTYESTRHQSFEVAVKIGEDSGPTLARARPRSAAGGAANHKINKDRTEFHCTGFTFIEPHTQGHRRNGHCYCNGNLQPWASTPR